MAPKEIVSEGSVLTSLESVDHFKALAKTALVVIVPICNIRNGSGDAHVRQCRRTRLRADNLTAPEFCTRNGSLRSFNFPIRILMDF